MKRLIGFGALSAALLPMLAYAQGCVCPAGGRCLCVGVGTSLSFFTIVQRIITFLAASISTIAVMMFVVGALLFTLSGVKEDWKQRGKDFMIGSVVALGVVAGAYGMLRMVDFFLRP